MRTFHIANYFFFFCSQSIPARRTRSNTSVLSTWSHELAMLTFSCWLSSRFLSARNLLTNLLVFIIFCFCAAFQISINARKGNTTCGKSVMPGIRIPYNIQLIGQFAEEHALIKRWRKWNTAQNKTKSTPLCDGKSRHHTWRAEVRSHDRSFHTLFYTRWLSTPSANSFTFCAARARH